MNEKKSSKKISFFQLLSFIIALSVFWLILSLRIPDSFSQFFHAYSFTFFVIVLVVFYIVLNLPHRYSASIFLGLIMVLIALPLSYKWTSGFSDNFMIAGLLPYKDGKNYFYGANLLLNGLPLVNANQSTERPLFPAFLELVLFLTGRDIKNTLAVLAQLIGIGIYLPTRQVHRAFGALPAGIFATLMCFYAQPMIGYAMSETIGFALGCVGFSILWLAATKGKWYDLVIGLAILMVAVSARAGTFFIFPMFAVWAGWAFRRRGGFSLRKSTLMMLVLIIIYLLVNLFYPRILGIPPGSSFGNFSYAIYGQVMGGTGWHSAIEDLGTRDSSVVFHYAWEYFLAHPVSLFIGFAKAYRDFFSLGNSGIFPFGWYSIKNIPSILLWASAILLLLGGIYRLLKNIRNDLSSMLIAGFIGVVLSIPFLPPVDGGARFYASTVPFFFIVPAWGAGVFLKKIHSFHPINKDYQYSLLLSRYISVAMLILTLIVPPLIYSLAQKPIQAFLSCTNDQKPFVIEYYPNSYVDIVNSKSHECGFVPEICYDDFEKNNIEKSVDDFYQFLLRSMQLDGGSIRLIPAIDFTEDKFHYFYLGHDKFPNDLPFGVVSGCAVEVKTKNQSIYQVESLEIIGN